MKIKSVVFGPAVLGRCNELCEKLIEAITKGGGELQRNPRSFDFYFVVSETGDKVWEMKAGEVNFRVVLTAKDVPLARCEGEGVLLVKFREQHQPLEFSTLGYGNYSISLSSKIDPGMMLQFANQIVADFVVNGRSRQYLPVSNKEKKERKGMSRWERWRKRRWDRSAGLCG